MSQAGFGDSSSQDRIIDTVHEPQYQSLSDSSSKTEESSLPLASLPRNVLERELQFCNERSQQAQILLRQAQEQLQLSQLVIQRQESLTQTLQSRIDQLERELEDAHAGCDELRDRLKRQQHHTSQLKAALERCLDTSTHATHATFSGDMAASALESWSISKLADEKITPIEAIGDHPLQNVVKIAPSPQPIESPELGNVADTEPSAEPQAIAEPTYLSIPPKSQPISPLIVRPHKASQGSPIAPNLPKLQLSGEPEVATNVPVSELVSDSVNYSANNQSNQPNQSIDLANNANNPREDYLNSQTSLPMSDAAMGKVTGSLQVSPSVITNSGVVPTVTTPKFIQALYGNSHNNAQDVNKAGSVISDQSEASATEPANTSRKVVTSLAAVQLPQFPPLPRR